MIKYFCLTLRCVPNRYYYSGSEWTLEVMALKEYPTFPKLQDWSLTIKWFCVISRTLISGGLPSLQRWNWHILQPQLTGLFESWGILLVNIWLWFAISLDLDPLPAKKKSMIISKVKKKKKKFCICYFFIFFQELWFCADHKNIWGNISS